MHIRSGRYLRFPVILLLCVFVYSSAIAQEAIITGMVTDEATGDPLPGANVVIRLSNDAKGAVADEAGQFRVVGIPLGQYEVSVSFIGYSTATFTVGFEAPGEVTSIDAALRQKGFRANPITITASRRREKLLDAPAAISVLRAEDVESRPTLTAGEHLKSLPAVDMITTGVNSSRVVVRGFNDNLASSLLTLVDNRIAQIPSVRLTALQLIPMANDDIEKIEVLAGPASALYGPNAANGVVHIVTKSPLDYPGTTVSVGGGERDVFTGSVRHARRFGDSFAYKVVAQYYTGRDFEFSDPVEIDARNTAILAGASEDTLRIGARDFDVQNLAFDVRADYRFRPDFVTTVNGGFTRGTNIEISPTGAVQADQARVLYGQARLRRDDLFLQTFVNHFDSGNSFSLRTGDRFVENTTFFVAQAQHSLPVGDWQRFTYGADAFLDRRDTEGTTNGRNEDDDSTNELGAYVQSDTDITGRVQLVAASRLDYHNRLDDLAFSPRVAVVVRPRLGKTIRVSYNRAFETPANNELFTDILGQRDVFQLGPTQSLFGFNPGVDLRAQGTPESGFTFRRSGNGALLFRSPFAPMDPRGLTRSSYIEVNDPVFTDVMWDVTRTLLTVGLPQQLADQGILASEQVDAVAQALQAVLPENVTGVENAVRLLDLQEGQFLATGGPRQVDPLSVTRTETIEAGFKGLFRERVLLGFDVYRTRVKNLIGPFLAASPSVFLDTESLRQTLQPAIQEALSSPELQQERETLLPLDRIAFIGNQDGDPSGEIAGLISLSAGQIPLGNVTPEQAYDPTALLLVRRNFGDLSVYGFDAYTTVYPNDSWTVGASYSFLNDNFFSRLSDVDDVSLNAPRHKFTASIQRRTRLLQGQLRIRYVGGFPVKSDIYSGHVDPYTVVDLSLNYAIPFTRDTRLGLSIQNLTNNKHREFVGVPEIGRLSLVRLTQSF
jgi:iron complex outermembrane receptor protein